MAKAIWAVLAACATLGLAAAAQAEDWYAFYMVPQGVAFVDKDSLIYRPGHISARIQSTFPEPQHLLRFGQVITYKKSIDVIDIDCKAQVYRFLGRDLFDDQGQEQMAINDADDPKRIGDHTPQQVLAKAFCKK